MGVNQQTSVPAFTVGQVLTAQQQTEINTGVPVFADTTARDAAFGGSGEKTLAEGQLAYLEDSNIVQYYDGSGWATVGPSADSGLTLISATTIGTTVSSVTVSGAFSATYDSYKIVVSGGAGSTSMDLLMQLGASTTGYYFGQSGREYAGAANDGQGANSANWRVGNGQTTGLAANLDVVNPFLADETYFASAFGSFTTLGSGFVIGGFHNSAVSYADFTLLTSSGTLTGGTIRVYGYKN
jgi:hypothetical protein